MSAFFFFNVEVGNCDVCKVHRTTCGLVGAASLLLPCKIRGLNLTLIPVKLFHQPTKLVTSKTLRFQSAGRVGISVLNLVHSDDPVLVGMSVLANETSSCFCSLRT